MALLDRVVEADAHLGNSIKCVTTTSRVGSDAPSIGLSLVRRAFDALESLAGD